MREKQIMGAVEWSKIGIFGVVSIIVIAVVLITENQNSKKNPNQCRCCGKKDAKTTCLPFLGGARFCLDCAREIMKTK